jgi:hypothetical protein
MRTGFEQRGSVQHPTLGAWAQHFLGSSHKTLPSSVAVNRSSNHGNGWFPAAYSPLPILNPDDGLLDTKSPVGEAVVGKRAALLAQLDAGFGGKAADENVKAYNEFYETTFQLMKSTDLKAFDLSAEQVRPRLPARPTPRRERRALRRSRPWRLGHACHLGRSHGGCRR